MQDCIFCKIVRGEIPSTRLHEDDTAIVFLDIDQAAKGHLLVVPRQHADHWHDLDPATAAHLTALSQRFATAVLNTLQPDGYNLQLNNGPAAGQIVPHVHLHIIPRWKDDHYYSGAPKNRTADPAELQSTAAEIKSAL